MRNKPSTKARIVGYKALNHLCDLLVKLVSVSFEEQFDGGIHGKAWKEFIIKHTPPEKRGGKNVRRKENKSITS